MKSTKKKSIAIIGGGAAALATVCFIDSEKYDVHLFEKTSRLGRKLLVAGEGGFNLTFQEPLALMKKKYHPDGFMDAAIDTFSNTDLIRWLSDLGIETFTGTSNKVFPIKGIKPYMVVNALLQKIEDNNVTIHTNATWTGWSSDSIAFLENDYEKLYLFDFVVFALGGSSWSKTGSDGSWLPMFSKKGIQCNAFQSSNCRWMIDWPNSIINNIEGKPLKNITLEVSNHKISGELQITKDGLEGGCIYAHASNIRREILLRGEADLSIDLKPSLDRHIILNRIKNRKKSMKDCLLREIKLSQTSYEILMAFISKADYNTPEKLVNHIKSLKIKTTQPSDLDKAISTVGGIDIDGLDEYFMFKKLPNSFAIGEMVDWDTRTGGYLLQACFSMGVHVAKFLNGKE